MGKLLCVWRGGGGVAVAVSEVTRLASFVIIVLCIEFLSSNTFGKNEINLFDFKCSVIYNRRWLTMT